MLQKLNWFCLTSLMTLVLLIWKWMDLFLSKNNLLRCWGWLSRLNWIEALTFSLFLKLPPEKLEPWFVQWSFILLRLLCISINVPYNRAWNNLVMWAGAPNCYLKLLDKLQKQICRTTGPWPAASLERLVHRCNATSLSLFYRY